LAIKAVPPVSSIGTTRGGSQAAMPNKMANNSPDNRTSMQPRDQLALRGQ
jgi:hypothetical protein